MKYEYGEWVEWIIRCQLKRLQYVTSKENLLTGDLVKKCNNL